MKPESGFVGVPKPKMVPEFCGKCHIGIKENYLESGHGKALMTTGRGPNCVTCHHSHDIQKANINIINEKLCGVCHSYDRAREMKAALLLTEQKINEIDRDLKTLKAGLIATQDEEKVLFQTQAEYRTLFHTVDVKLVQAKTGEFSKKLATIMQQVRKGFQELKFRQDFSILHPVNLHRPGDHRFPFRSQTGITQSDKLWSGPQSLVSGGNSRWKGFRLAKKGLGLRLFLEPDGHLTPEGFHVEVEDRGDIEGEELGDEQAAHHGDAQGPAGLGPGAEPQGDGQGAHEGRHGGHHDGPEPDQGPGIDGLLGALAAVAGPPGRSRSS